MYLIDAKSVRFGFREIEMKDAGLFVNGKKVLLRGMDRHQSYPYVGYAMPASMQKFDADILKNELGLNAVLTIEKSDKKIAKTIVSNTKKKSAEILEMDSLQSITQKDIKADRSYLSAMKKNLEVLKKALR